MANSGLFGAFTRIDRDNDGVIKISDLEAYAKTENVAPDFVQKWQLLFDPDNTGEITFDRFCDILAISKKKKEEMIVERKMNQIQSAVPSRPHIYASNMDKELESKVMRIFEDNWSKENPESGIQQSLMICDQQLGPRWRYRSVTSGIEPPCDEARNNSHIIFGFDNGSKKHCVWKQAEDGAKRSGGCCFC